jgi:hypothetical protein
MPSHPLTIDNRSGWATAPAAARLEGAGEVFRFFETAEAATAFLHQATRAADRQRRRRERCRRHEIVVPTPIGEPVIDVLVDLRWLSEKDADSRNAIAGAIAGLLNDLAKHRYA